MPSLKLQRRLRDECLNSHVFVSVAEAQALLDAWRDDYNRGDRTARCRIECPWNGLNM